MERLNEWKENKNSGDTIFQSEEWNLFLYSATFWPVLTDQI